jgi:UDP-N-acetylmuramoyl-tripeptide--D-alanyl-D-alanine ligase
MFKVQELLEATEGRLQSGKPVDAVKGISIDTRTIKPQEAFLCIKGENFDGHDFIEKALRKGAKAVIGERGVRGLAKTHPGIAFLEVPKAVKALGDIARFHRRRFNIPVIAVTGSNGKTTTKEMIAWVLSKSFRVLKTLGTKNNQIGVPLALLSLRSFHEVALLEMGTNHFGEIEYLAGVAQPNMGVITNIGPSHLEHFKDLKGVFREKYALIDALKKPGIAVLNADDAYLKQKTFSREKEPFCLSFGMKNKSDFQAADLRRFPQSFKFTINRKYRFTLKTLGVYNVYNALAAVACAVTLGMRPSELAPRMAAFPFPENRLQLLELKNLRFINDVYNANPLSLEQALSALHDYKARGRKIFIMGDMLELGGGAESFHRQAGKRLTRICDAFIAVGPLSGLAAAAAREEGFEPQNIFTCANNLKAREILFEKLNPLPDDIILVKGSRAMKLEEIFKF